MPISTTDAWLNKKQEVVHTIQRLTKSVNKTPKSPFCNIVITSVNGKTGIFVDQFFVHLLCRTFFFNRKAAFRYNQREKMAINEHDVNGYQQLRTLV